MNEWSLWVWNLVILIWAALFTGFITETGNRVVAMQIVFYVGLSISIVFWFGVLIVKVAIAT